jgi:hypothetical protein
MVALDIAFFFCHRSVLDNGFVVQLSWSASMSFVLLVVLWKIPVNGLVIR